MNSESILKETTQAANEAMAEINRWCTILRMTDISDVATINVCRGALAAWDKVHNELLGRISFLSNSNKINLH